MSQPTYLGVTPGGRHKWIASLFGPGRIRKPIAYEHQEVPVAPKAYATVSAVPQAFTPNVYPARRLSLWRRIINAVINFYQKHVS